MPTYTATIKDVADSADLREALGDVAYRLAHAGNPDVRPAPALISVNTDDNSITFAVERVVWWGDVPDSNLDYSRTIPATVTVS